MENYEEQMRKRDIREAKTALTLIDAMTILAGNNNLACMIDIAGLRVGICNNKKIIPALKHQKAEIEKFLKGEKNEYE